jgi:hypothetical protein
MPSRLGEMPAVCINIACKEHLSNDPMMMETETVTETSNIEFALTWVIVKEGIIVYFCCESFNQFFVFVFYEVS